MIPSDADLTIRWAIFALVAGVRVTGTQSAAASSAKRIVATSDGAKGAWVILGILGIVKVGPFRVADA